PAQPDSYARPVTEIERTCRQQARGAVMQHTFFFRIATRVTRVLDHHRRGAFVLVVAVVATVALIAAAGTRAADEKGTTAAGASSLVYLASRMHVHYGRHGEVDGNVCPDPEPGRASC